MSPVHLALTMGCAALGCGSGHSPESVAIIGALEPNAPNVPNEEEARDAAASWLAIVDRGNYEESWHAASEAFRQNMARFGKSIEFWVEALEISRMPLGDLDRRTVTRTAEATGMPGASEDRKYLELTYESRFEEADAVTETVVVTLDPDGVWRVFNYVIQR